MNISIMMSQEHNFSVSKPGLQRNASGSSYQAKRHSWTSNHGKNRLGPYTTTHLSAQIKALEMLDLRPNDVFFDLGCSDGRLIVMALQEAIDQEIEERRKVALNKSPPRSIKWHHLRCDENNEDCIMGECCHIKQRVSQESRGSKVEVDPLKLHHSHSAPSVLDSQDDPEEEEGHKRNHSFDSFTFPHLMRNSSNDSLFDDIQDEISVDDFDGVLQHRPSWHSAAPTPQDDKSPLTPLISNRKTLENELGRQTNLNQPLNGKVQETNTKSNGMISGLKTLHPPVIGEEDDERPKLTRAGAREGELTACHGIRILYRSCYESSSLLQTKIFLLDETNQTLKCVGIELDESLVDRARTMVNKALSKYQNESFCPDPDVLSKRISVRCGDILDEWLKEFKIEGDKSVEQLTLLDDATAVFVYLSPEGLKKVKPLLLEAALRRRRNQQNNILELNRCDSVQQWRDILEKIHQQQPEPVDELELLNAEDKTPLESISKCHQSRISDITVCDSDWDGRSRLNSDCFDQGKEDDIHKAIAGSPLSTNMLSNMSSLLKASPPLFRIVSYLHPIPGWRATRIDRSSCGNCPLYYYEDVDHQDD